MSSDVPRDVPPVSASSHGASASPPPGAAPDAGPRPAPTGPPGAPSYPPPVSAGGYLPARPVGGSAAAASPPPQGGFKRGLGLGIGAGIGLGASLVVLGLIGSLLTALVLAGIGSLVAGSSANAATPPVTTVWGPENADKTLRAVAISGTILTDSSDGSLIGGGTYGYEVARMIDAIDADQADGLILRINTPGGTITGAKAIADAVQRYQDRTKHKVFAHVEGMSASGGMYAMAGADEISADYGSMVGSIGVIFGPFQRFKDVTAITGTLLTPGVETRGGITEYYLSQGTGKDAGNPYRDLTAQERSIFLTGLRNEYDMFVNHVATNRDIPAATIKNDLGAHLFDNKTATEKKLIDSTLGLDAAFRRAAELNGLDPGKTKVVEATAPNPLAQLLGAQSRIYGQAPALGAAERASAAVNPMCSGAPTVLAYQGNLAKACGA